MDIETATQLTIVVLQALFNTLVSSSVVFFLNMAAGVTELNVGYISVLW